MKTPVISSTKKFIDSVSKHLGSDNYTFVNGSDLINVLKGNEQLDNFSNYWNNLCLDTYMADGGTYRLRRYGQFSYKPGCHDFEMLPHEQYFQPSYINSLNGGIERKFEPLEDNFAKHPLLHNVLGFLTQVYNETKGHKCNWNIRLHPYRIIASPDQKGLPTPEGLHRDGVTYIAVLMINRFNIDGGITTITDEKKSKLLETQLTNPFDLYLADDSATMHAVSPISKADDYIQQAYRDVLVIAFTELPEEKMVA